MSKNDFLPIGELARRTGLSVSSIRFYEEKRLLSAMRTSGNQRRFLRSDIRRLSFIMIAQKLGLPLSDIEDQLAKLPQGRTPNARDWKTISASIRDQLDARIAMLERTRDRLDGCIGCGCLSLSKCQLYNRDDKIGEGGSGPRLVLD
ncbi:redox-sensitive transcriptional activator SoxR [Pontixanthobacter gangjinensis]|uniref:Redox-sensitive transcriptional activator SoxR n=1 Tax=Pontixanthobacter gangjinensis TaxID=1028742 RepID=A0A6I4SNU8_9SPHN|nr:redox-sensitive transcriptional activator SoxR [Pontixanthobacter gangjinensis]MXO57404.1 redox-sensitive transcriptional activator SoxR [Pontixanthobacter gangjinensis]